ncbi:hypothetical protein J6590_014579 [Homalodisca vitripennis]|nr:hypothetical protein J6590_014579 [Homalodisca vitripennis]
MMKRMRLGAISNLQSQSVSKSLNRSVSNVSDSANYQVPIPLGPSSVVPSASFVWRFLHS